ncbi:hypothetical protein AMS68_006401 [Peltaster fructicola]|uniref:Uncharacterized protein n=1 Tax=Peltaster fructicola TaxID=286661 RepID=A0A6H0Y1J9_9PEZI|nr:hypothetical protein AMS68_006401 [Peltaster fructicola]
MLVWPKEARDIATGSDAPGSWTVERTSPAKRRLLSHDLASSPPLNADSRRTPLSPGPPLNLAATFTSTFRADQSPVKVYEDHSSDDDAPHESTTPVPLNTSRQTVTGVSADLFKSLASEIEDLSEHDEENDPIVHSFGPFGDNILSKLASFHPVSPQQKRTPLTASPNRRTSTFRPSPIKNHVINQLAFSRVHSLPLSTIHTNLPAELRGAMAKPSDTENADILTTSGLKTMLDDIPCVGEISREGKDAAGKLLESEFYYIPERDTDVMRRETVTLSLGKTSIRSARKQHKQYYWKRPRH